MFSSSHAGLDPGDFPRLEASDPKLTKLRKIIPTIRTVLAHPQLIAVMPNRPHNPFERVELTTPTAEEISRIPHWARVAFAGRCAQLAVPQVQVPDDEEHAEAHFSAVEQAAAFPARCAATGQILDLPPFEHIQFGEVVDPVPQIYDWAVITCVCAALTPFGATGADTASMAAIAADYASWVGLYFNGGATRTEQFDLAVKTNTAIWNALGKLYEASQAQAWTDKTPVAEEFFAEQPASKRPVVFLCHAKEDAEKAKELFHRLRANQMDPWLDKYSLVVGDDWELEIKNAVHRADAFVVCLRNGFDDIGFRQKEIRWAREALELRPPGRGFIIPYRLEPCPLPEWLAPFHAGADSSKSTTFQELLTALNKHARIQRSAAAAGGTPIQEK